MTLKNVVYNLLHDDVLIFNVYKTIKKWKKQYIFVFKV